jgi:ABC-type branched-subunit amino acid transport system substrate-binding protein
LVKIGLVAPFEGRYRDVGYEVIYAVRLAVREANAQGGVGGYSVELTALDDNGDVSLSVEQARKMATDPLVVGVIGNWLDPTTLSAAPTYAAERLPLLATTTAALPTSAFRLWLTPQLMQTAAADGVLCPLPCATLDDLSWLRQTRSANAAARVYGPPLWEQQQFATLADSLANGVRFLTPAPFPADLADHTFAGRYRAMSNGVEPRANAVLAYDAARLLLAAIAANIRQSGAPSRAGVEVALAQVHFQGLSGPISFDANRNWAEARAWVYEWENGAVSRR